MDVPATWRILAKGIGVLTMDQLDRLVASVLMQSQPDAEHDRIRHIEPDRQLGKASGRLVGGGAEVEFTLGGIDVYIAEERAHHMLKHAVEDAKISSISLRFTVDCTLIGGQVIDRWAHEQHIGSAIDALSRPLQDLKRAEEEIKLALIYADAVGQERGGLERSANDAAGLYILMYEASLPLLQRLAQVEVGTKG